MAKNIVVCSDGTGNTAVKDRGTNVFKLFESIDLNGHRLDPVLAPQVAIYDDGVGTESLKPLRIFAGITGWGLSHNVKQLYKELCRIYDPGDRIFLFGFSRGAFTVRTLGGLILTCGIINVNKFDTAAAFNEAVREAYKAYRQCYRTILAQFILGKPTTDAAAQFRKQHCHEEKERIAFIGVWDTVDAVGLPFHLSDVINSVIYRFKFPNQKLSDRVDHACHALAVDDERRSFHPLLWDQTEPSANASQKIEQVWFAGAHSNVGGGYPKQGMSLIALDWMMQRASESGLRFGETDRKFSREHANVDDMLYDPRDGFGIFYRWAPRDIKSICEESNVAPAIHLSVMERIAHGTDDYAPGNLAPNASVVITPTGDAKENESAMARALNAQNVLRAEHGGNEPLLSKAGIAIAVGRLSSYVFLAAFGVLLVSALTPPGETASAWETAKNVARLIWQLVASPLDTLTDIAGRLKSSPRVLTTVAVLFVIAYAMANFTDRRLSAVFSQFWHKAQQKLREALKRARTKMLRAGSEKS